MERGGCAWWGGHGGNEAPPRSGRGFINLGPCDFDYFQTPEATALSLDAAATAEAISSR
jgi:hypothetical protein